MLESTPKLFIYNNLPSGYSAVLLSNLTTCIQLWWSSCLKYISIDTEIQQTHPYTSISNVNYKNVTSRGTNVFGRIIIFALPPCVSVDDTVIHGREISSRREFCNGRGLDKMLYILRQEIHAACSFNASIENIPQTTPSTTLISQLSPIVAVNIIVNSHYSAPISPKRSFKQIPITST